jgi:hypothetical protein
MSGAAVARRSAVAVRRFSTGFLASGRTDSRAVIEVVRDVAARRRRVVLNKEVRAVKRCWNLGVSARSAISVAVK